MFEIISKEMLSPAICRMKVYAPRLAASARPGQFLIVIPEAHGERIPLTISDYDAEAGTVTIVTQRIGVSTGEICSLEVGDRFSDVTGPLGHPSDFVGKTAEELSGEHYVFIAGGVGTAPVYPQVKYLHSLGVKADVIIGAKTSDLLIYKEEMAAVCDNLHICTDDGSEGFHGMVTGLLEKLVNEDGKKYTMAVAIGPMIMMKFATLTAGPAASRWQARQGSPVSRDRNSTAMKWISTKPCAARGCTALRSMRRQRNMSTNARSVCQENGRFMAPAGRKNLTGQKP